MATSVHAPPPICNGAPLLQSDCIFGHMYSLLGDGVDPAASIDRDANVCKRVVLLQNPALKREAASKGPVLQIAY